MVFFTRAFVEAGTAHAGTSHPAGALTRSCAHWLNWQCGIDFGAAREKVRVACAGTEAVLLELGLHGTARHVGSLVIEARLPAEAGTLVLRALEQAVADIPLPDPAVQQDVSAETRCGAGFPVTAKHTRVRPADRQSPDCTGGRIVED